MTSIRVPADLLARLHEAKPSGVPLARVVEAALLAAGGPERLRAQLEAEIGRANARAKVARLARMGHRSVVLDPDQQVALAEATADWCALLSRRGRRRFDPEQRTLELSPSDPTEGRRRGMRIDRGVDL